MQKGTGSGPTRQLQSATSPNNACVEYIQNSQASRELPTVSQALISPRRCCAPQARLANWHRANTFYSLAELSSAKESISCCRRLHKRRGRLMAQCVIAGDGLDLEPMRLLAKHLQIDARVHFVGHVDGDDKIWLLQNAIATVMPSRVWEGCPLVALESFAAGRPVIATKTAGLQELIQPDRTGLLVPAESPTGLADALVRRLATAHKPIGWVKPHGFCAAARLVVRSSTLS